MSERMTTKDEAEDIRREIMAAVDALEDGGIDRSQTGAAIVGIGAGLVAAHLGYQRGLDVLNSTRDALLMESSGKN